MAGVDITVLHHHLLKNFLLLCILSALATAQLKNEALEQCVESDAFGMASGALPDPNLEASSWTQQRDGRYGRLFNQSAWQASSNNYNQYLQITLPATKLITSVATQGYRGSNQFVLDYYIHYSNDGTTFIPVVNDLGEPNVFPGNMNDDAPQFNTFEYPLVAMYVRLVPRRWNINIAMRAELYGCNYDSSTASFNGDSRVWFNAHEPNTLFTVIDMMRFRMKTSEPEGVLFYAGGNQGDYISLEMKYGLLYLDISLGSLSWSKSSARGVAGSLLDDNQWHDVEMVRQDKNITISVDRVPVNITIGGEYQRLDLDRFLYLGGVPTFYMDGITVFKNFQGCIQNFVWNGIHMTRDMDRERFGVTGIVGRECTQTTEQPLSLPLSESNIEYVVKAPERNQLQFKLQFRTYDKERLIVWNNMLNEGVFFLTINRDGHLEYELKPVGTSTLIMREALKSDKNNGDYADGLWHDVIFNARKDFVNITVDGKEFITSTQLEFTAGRKFFIGGGHTEKQGFVGCIRGLYIQYSVTDGERVSCVGDTVTAESMKCTSVELDTCGLEDKCHPNPCEHDSICQQTFRSFTCNCDNTGYKGATCHQSLYPNSCSRVFELNKRDSGQLHTSIDIDGAGAMAPFAVECEYNTETGIVSTKLHHDSEESTYVDGYQAPGSYKRDISYTTDIPQIDQLVDRAERCEQSIGYQCSSSRLLLNPGTGGNPITDGSNDGTGPELGQVYQAYGWWFGRNYQDNYYWGGSAPGTGKCACGLEGTCENSMPTCNCDAGLESNAIGDSGLLQHKAHLPVLQLRFGDTGQLNDKKRGFHTLGPLQCYGDKLFDKPVTFRKQDSIIFFDTFWSRNSWELQTWDISFRFKTTAESGVMVYRTGVEDFIEIKLSTSISMSFRFSAGYGVQALVNEVAFSLNDNEWHTVYAERNRKEAVLQIDEFEPVVKTHPEGVGFLPFQFNKPLVVGATIDYKDGFVGCMSSLQVNGETLDLYDKVENDPIFSYGLSKGCHGKCESNPCLNGGKCKEKYSDFVCDCSYTPFRGLICGREVGTLIMEGQMLEYRPEGDVSTNNENITIGFYTRDKSGVIMQLSDDKDNPTEYMIIEMNNEGGIRVHFEFNEQRMQVNTDFQSQLDFANGQPHIIKYSRTGRGTMIELQVDDYEPITREDLSRELPVGTDSYLDNVKYILLGRNTTDGSQFKGCIFRAEFDNHWPIKKIFEAPRPSFVSVYDRGMNDGTKFNSIREEKCGSEEILPPDEPVEIRPTFEPPVDRTGQQRQEEAAEGQNSIYLGAIFGAVGIILIAFISLVVYKCRHVGAYPESTDDELEILDSPGADNSGYGSDYNPTSRSREKYEMKSRNAAFI